MRIRLVYLALIVVLLAATPRRCGLAAGTRIEDDGNGTAAGAKALLQVEFRAAGDG